MHWHRDGQWKLQPFKDKAPAFFFEHPPCWFHRWMQRVFFGFKWEKQANSAHSQKVLIPNQ